MIKIVLLLLLPFTTIFGGPSKINFSGSMTVGYLDTENHREHFITGSDYNDGIGSFDLGKLEFYLDAPLSKEIVVSTQLNWDGDSNPTIELSYLRFQNAFGKGNVIDVGKVLNPFGNFIRRKQAQFNSLYGNPLIYDYRTNLRSDSYPTNAAELVALKGSRSRNFTHSRNFLVDGVANNSTIDGMPIIDSRYPVGLIYFSRHKNIDYYLGLTNNALSNNTSRATSKQKNFLAKVAYSSGNKLKVGISLSAGSYLDSRVPFPVGYSSDDYLQKVAGIDFSYRNNNLIINSEIISNAFESPRIAEDLKTDAYYIETQYFWTDASYGAVRVGGLNFGNISSAGGSSVTWDNDRSRIEVGVGYYMNRDVLTKVFIQDTDTKGSNIKDSLYGIQLNAVF